VARDRVDVDRFDVERVAFRGALFRGALFGGALLRGVAWRGVDVPDWLAFVSSPGLLNCRTSKAVPPTVSSSGHSTNPVAPIAPNVSKAAGVEWLPALSPLRTPAALPCTPPMMPVIAAPLTAPAAAVVAFAASVTTRVAPRTIFISLPALYCCLSGNRMEYPASALFMFGADA
jgi:hypothetical protein